MKIKLFLNKMSEWIYCIKHDGFCQEMQLQLYFALSCLCHCIIGSYFILS